jgi:hypothetical protein
MADLDFQNLSTVQSNQQPKPATIASAATIAPTTYLSVITGTVAIATITPPVSGACQLAFVFTTTTPVAFTTTGNIANVTTPTTNVLQVGVYNPSTNKWHFK